MVYSKPKKPQASILHQKWGKDYFANKKGEEKKEGGKKGSKIAVFGSNYTYSLL